MTTFRSARRREPADVVEAVHSERYDNNGGSRTCTLARSSGGRSFLRFAIGERPQAVRLHGMTTQKKKLNLDDGAGHLLHGE